MTFSKIGLEILSKFSMSLSMSAQRVLMLATSFVKRFLACNDVSRAVNFEDVLVFWSLRILAHVISVLKMLLNMSFVFIFFFFAFIGKIFINFLLIIIDQHDTFFFVY